MKSLAIRECIKSIKKWDPAKEGVGEIFRYIDIASISQDEKIIIPNGEILTSEAPSRARQLIKSGDVLVSTVRPNLNAVALVPKTLDGATASTGFCVLRTDQQRLDGCYLFHWVRTNKFVAEMVKQATGQSYPAVSDKIVKDSLIPLPPLEEQKRIAAILDQADSLRRLRQRAIDCLNTLGQAIFYGMFGDPKANTKGLPKDALGNLIKVSSGDGLTSENMRDGPYPVYGGNGINGWHDKSIVAEDTIIIGRVGVYCGAVHVTESAAWVTDNALIVCKKREINSSYLASALKYSDLNQYAGRSAQPLVSGSRIYPIEIPVPPLEEQESFEHRVKVIQSELERHLQAKSRTNVLFSSLQHRAFRGEM